MLLTGNIRREINMPHELTQTITMADRQEMQPVTHELPSLEYSLEWLKTQGECAQVVLGFIESLQK